MQGEASQPPAARVPRLEKLWVTGILLILFGALVWQAWRIGVTVDEPSHLLSSSLYWHQRDNLRPCDMPPVMKITGGWVPALFGLPIPADLGYIGDRRHEWNESQRMMEKLPPQKIQVLYFWSRLPLLIFPLLTAWLIWHWGRQLFTPLVGVLLMVLFAAEPTALGHGSLFKNDHAATFGYLLFWYRAWRHWRAPGTATTVWLGAALLLAIMSKLSMLVLLPIAVFAAALPLVWKKPRRPLYALAAVALVLGIAYLGTVTLYQFRVHQLSARTVEALTAQAGLPRPVALTAHVFRVLPVASRLWDGCLSLWDNNRASNAYLFEKRYPQGTPLYFLAALAVKTPVPLQILLLMGGFLAAVGLVRRRFTPADALWLAPGFLYIGMASMSALQLGVRLVLPALPFGLLLAGVALEWLTRRRKVILTAAFVVPLVAEAAVTYPNGIAFFNVLAGGPANGLRYLADSNLDWGQGLPQLADYVRTHHINRLKLSYFGNDIPLRFFTEAQIEQVPPPWAENLARGDTLRPAPGYHAISATLLPGHYFAPRYRNYFEAFRKATPVARVGYSIYLYRF